MCKHCTNADGGCEGCVVDWMRGILRARPCAKEALAKSVLETLSLRKRLRRRLNRLKQQLASGAPHPMWLRRDIAPQATRHKRSHITANALHVELFRWLRSLFVYLFQSSIIEINAAVS